MAGSFRLSDSILSLKFEEHPGNPVIVSSVLNPISADPTFLPPDRTPDGKWHLFVHTIGLHEAESPFFGPHSSDVLEPGMTVCIDVSFFGHPEWNGVRIETGYKITAKGPVPLSPKMDKLLTA